MTDRTPGTKNEHGVYCPHEVLRLPYEKKGWRGVDRVKIELVETPEGWRSEMSVAFFSGDFSYSGSAVSIHNKPHPTRRDAINEQVERLRYRLAKRVAPEMQGDVHKMLAWADSLNPDQMDLFGRAV